MRIGILGGTFNPVHLGHLVLAQDARELFGLERVLFLPCHHPPHKAGVAPAAHRLAMLRAAVRGNPAFAVCDLELRRGGLTYTVDTMRALDRRLAPATPVFIIGSDTLLELHLWKDIGRLLNTCRFAILVRPGCDPGDLRPRDLKLPAPWPRRLLRQAARGHALDISSSDLRRRAAAGLSLQYLVPAVVAKYIADRRLYV